MGHGFFYPPTDHCRSHDDVHAADGLLHFARGLPRPRYRAAGPARYHRAADGLL